MRGMHIHIFVFTNLKRGGGAKKQLISKEINNVQHEYKNMPPPIIKLAMPCTFLIKHLTDLEKNCLQPYRHHLSVNLHCTGQSTPQKVIKHRVRVKQLAAVRTPP